MVLDILGYIFVIIGALFIFIGNLGVYRMPDVFNKLQAGTKATTMGFLSMAAGLLCFQPQWSLKIILIAVFILVTNPIGSHALARASKKTGEKMFHKEEKKGA